MLEGQSVVDAIEKKGSQSGTPSATIKIVDSGELKEEQGEL